MKKWIMGYGVQVGPCFGDTYEYEVEVTDEEYEIILTADMTGENFEDIPELTAITEREYPNIKKFVLEAYDDVSEDELSGINIWTCILSSNAFQEHDAKDYIENYDEYMETCKNYNEFIDGFGDKKYY